MAISKITTKAITDGTIATADLADNAVNSAKIGADVIVAEDVANNAITVNEIQNGAVTSAKLDTNIAIGGTLTVTGASILNGGIDVAGDFNFDVGGGDITFKDDGTSVVNFGLESGNFIVNAPTSNTDIIFKGNDGGSTITAMTIDMSDEGAAIFNKNIAVGGQISLSGGTAQSSDFTSGGIHFHDSSTSAGDVMPISFTPSASGNRARAAVGFISAQASGVDGFAGEIGLYTRDAADGTALGTSDERVRIDKSGRVGIGTTSPIATLHTASGSSGRSWSSGVDRVIHEANGTNIMQIVTSTTGTAGINFADTDARAVSGVEYDHNAKNMAISVNEGSGTIKFFNTTERVRIDSSGRVGIGESSPAYLFTVFGNAASNYVGSFHNDGNNANRYVLRLAGGSDSGSGTSYLVGLQDGDSNSVGSITHSGGNASFNTSSDYRLKENVVDMTGAINRLKSLTPKQFNFIRNPDTTIDGFIAHEAQAIVPAAVSGTKDAVDDDGNAIMQGIDQSKLVPLLTGALKEAIAKIEVLETKVATLESS